MAQFIWLEPVYKEMIWGSELWVISAHPNGDCKIAREKYKGMFLSELWNAHPELFAINNKEQFPLLVKIIDAKEDLSIQVHPDDAYAAKNEKGSLGKTECWYILDCKEDAEIVIGHHAKDKDEMEQMIHGQRWDEFIRVVPIHKGDFFQINPGCLHAIKGGTVILETQQSSDITYRVYDYDRLSDGKMRPLHIGQSLDVISVPFEETVTEREITYMDGARKTHLVTCPFYQVECYEVEGEFIHNFDGAFTNVTVLAGMGTINGEMIEKGVSFIIPSGMGPCTFGGDMTFICSRPF